MTFATYYAKKRGESKPHRVAITHVAKKLIRVIYTLERQDIDFNAQKPIFFHTITSRITRAQMTDISFPET